MMWAIIKIIIKALGIITYGIFAILAILVILTILEAFR